MAILLFFFAIPLLLIFWIVGIYNTMIGLRNRRQQSFSDIDVHLKQRNDLIPQLVETVKAYASYEKTTLEKIVQARNESLNAVGMNDKIAADYKVTQALQGLKVSVEAYPDLKANQNFLHLQQEIADIENKLAAARRFFNAATTEYNTSIEKFPNAIIAKRFNFQREPLYDLGLTQRNQLDQPSNLKF